MVIKRGCVGQKVTGVEGIDSVLREGLSQVVITEEKNE